MDAVENKVIHSVPMKLLSLLALLYTVITCHAQQLYKVSKALNNFTACVAEFSSSKYNVTVGAGTTIYYMPVDREGLDSRNHDAVFMGCLIAYTRGLDILLVSDFSEVSGDIVHDPTMLLPSYDWSEVLIEASTTINPYYNVNDGDETVYLEKRDSEYTVERSGEDSACRNTGLYFWI